MFRMKKITSALIGILFIVSAYGSGENNSTEYESKINDNTAEIEVKNRYANNLDALAGVLAGDAWKIINKNPNVNQIVININLLCVDSYGDERNKSKTITLDSEWIQKVEITKYKTAHDFQNSSNYLSLMGDLEYFNTPCNNW